MVKKMVNNIKIKNFGPIKEANIDISPLTIFIGPNSSGKSYSALLTHALLNPFDEENPPNKRRFQFGFNSLKVLMDSDDSDLLISFDEKITEFIKSKPKLSDSLIIPSEEFFDLINKGAGVFYKNLVEERIKNLFGVEDLNDLINLTNDFFEFNFNELYFQKNQSEFKLENFEHYIEKIGDSGDNSIKNNIVMAFIVKNDKVEFKLNYHLLMEGMEGDGELIPLLIYNYIADELINYLIKDKSFYIPAERDSLAKRFEFSLSDELNDLIEFSKTQKELATNFLKNRQKSKKKIYYDLAHELEMELFGGEIDFKDDEIFKEIVFSNKEKGFEFPLNLVSSSIRELTPVIFHLKYILDKGDTLIIEEPEAHLHPRNQRILVKYFVKAINEGLNIILTTHSDYIIEQFNNFVRLGNSDEKILKELNYDKTNILNDNDIRIYHFKDDGNYNFISNELNINFTGFNEENFTEVIEDLYVEAEKINDSSIR